jgi:hypothetical protein
LLLHYFFFSLCQSGAKGPQCVFCIDGCLTCRWFIKKENWETSCNLVLDTLRHTHCLLWSSCSVFSTIVKKINFWDIVKHTHSD